MKKTFKNKLPKGMQPENVKARIENGHVIVDVELKEDFNPKDGDFLVDKYGDIFIYNGKSDTSSYGCYIGDDGMGSVCIESADNWVSKYGCRYASKEEKYGFLNRLKSQHNMRWNAEKKCLEDIYIPKFGDIVKVICPNELRGYMICIFPNKHISLSYKNNFYNIANIDKKGDLNFNCVYNTGRRIIPATESERQELFDKLKEVGKRWNPETKQLEDIRWKPKEGELYYFINPVGVISASENSCRLDKEIIKIGNCFKSEKSAEPYAEKFKEIFKE